MITNTMKWRITKYNILFIIGFVIFTAIVFNFAIRFYLEKDISQQLNNIVNRAEETALRQGPDFFKKREPPPGSKKAPDSPPDDNSDITSKPDKIYQFYFMLDRSLRETLSVLNADFILYDTDKQVINTVDYGYLKVPDNVLTKINNDLTASPQNTYLNFSLSGQEYTAIIKSVSAKNSFGLGWIVIYSSLEKVNQIQFVINTILIIILILSSIVMFILSSLAAKKISAPFSTLSKHMSKIAQRNFRIKLDLPVDDELSEVIKNINIMTEKLDSYDKAQQTFLQNASHEFRTPLMSIQSYAEGIKYEVIDTETAVNVIIEETKRMTNLVEDLLYLSRLDAIEENYHFSECNISNLVSSCISRLNAIALQNGITISVRDSSKNSVVHADEEKLSRAVTNIIANDIRYASETVAIELNIADYDNSKLKLTILDDGPGFDPKELPNIFDRFYKGKKGNFGLGLAIAKNVIEKHNGRISAVNTDEGALFIIELPKSM